MLSRRAGKNYATCMCIRLDTPQRDGRTEANPLSISRVRILAGDQQEVQLMLTNSRDAFIGRSRSSSSSSFNIKPNIMLFYMLGIVHTISVL